nr:hypothetical protein [Tanacetum cinerariifolium]
DPPSSDYIPGPDEPEQAPPSPDYVPGLEHADDEILAEDQPMMTTRTVRRILLIILLMEEMTAMTRREEEEHPALADSVVVASTAVDQVPSAEETEPFETKISIPAPVPMPAWSDSEVVRMLAMSSPPA